MIKGEDGKIIRCEVFLLSVLKRIMVICLIGTLLFPTISSANKLQELENKKNENELFLQDNQRKMQEIQEKKDALYDEISELDLEIADLQDQINDFVAQIDQLNLDIEEAEQEIGVLETNIEHQTEDFKKRIKAMYINSKIGNLEVLLASDDLSNLLSRASMMKFVTEYDVDILNNLKHFKLELDAKKAELAGKKSAAEIAKQKLEENNDILQNKLIEKHQLVDSLSEDMIATQEEIFALEQKVLAINEQIETEKEAIAKAKEAERQRKLLEEKRRAEAKLNAARQAQRKNEIAKTSSYKTGNGRLGWPLPSSRRITSYYGTRNNPTGYGIGFHQGLDIGAPSGSIIVAAEAGIVTHTAYTGSYGNLVKVRHSNGLETYYGHCSGFVAHVGQKVNRGDAIALVGSTGNSTGPHLHFEVRVNGSHTDPLYFLSN